MSTPLASNLILCAAQFDTLVTKCHFFSRIIYKCRSFYVCWYLDIEYFFKFAEFKLEAYIASEVISNSWVSMNFINTLYNVYEMLNW